MQTDELTETARQLADRLRQESNVAEGSETAILALDSPSVTKSLAVEIAREITGVRHGSKKDALAAVRGWYRHRRAAQASLDKIHSSANTH